MSKWITAWQGQDRTCTRTLRPGAWARLWAAKRRIAGRDWPGREYLARVYYARMKADDGVVYQVPISSDGYRLAPCASWKPRGLIVHVVDPQ